MTSYVPFKHLEFDSDYSMEETLQIIRNSVAPIKWLQPMPSPKPFIGRVNREGFMICRAIGYRNSFQPVAYGTFSEINPKIHVSIIISFDYGTLALSVIMIPGAIFFWFILSSIFKTCFALGPLVVVSLYILLMRFYHSESEQLSEFLLTLLGSKKAD